MDTDAHMLYTYLYIFIHVECRWKRYIVWIYRACMCFCTSEFLHSLRTHIFGDNHVQDSKLWREPTNRSKFTRDHKLHVKPLPGLVRLASAQMTQASLFASVFVLFGLRSCFCSKHPETTLRQWSLVEMGRFYTWALQRFRWKRACASLLRCQNWTIPTCGMLSLKHTPPGASMHQLVPFLQFWEVQVWPCPGLDLNHFLHSWSLFWLVKIM